jgi:hypothetical protein
MRKTALLLFVMVLLVSPAFAQQAGRNSRASQISPDVARLLHAYSRMNRAKQQSDAAALSGRTKSPLFSVPNDNLAPPAIPSALPPGDRPFDANASGVTPFGPTISLPGSSSNLPPAFGPSVNPFSPGQSTVNPFTTASPSPATPFFANPAGASASPGISLGSPVTAIPNAPVIRKAPQLRLQPMEGLSAPDSPLGSNPFSSLSGSDPLSASRSPYPFNSPFPGSWFQPSAYP